MKNTVSSSGFAREFRDYGREDNFTSLGLDALYDYLVSLEEDTGDEWELDVIALCCEYTEYDDVAEYNNDYSTEYETREEIEAVVCTVGSDGFICYAH